MDQQQQQQKEITKFWIPHLKKKKRQDFGFVSIFFEMAQIKDFPPFNDQFF